MLDNSKKREISIAIVGAPNSGKTSLYNHISGEHEHTGNYSGVTVDATSSSFNYKGYKIEITDFPGVNALSTNTPDELYREMGKFFFNPGVLTPSLFNDDALFEVLASHGIAPED